MPFKPPTVNAEQSMMLRGIRSNMAALLPASNKISDPLSHIILDITATLEERATDAEWKTADQLMLFARQALNIRKGILKAPSIYEQVCSATEWMDTHAANARKAMLIAAEHAERSPPDIDDKAYWQHEIAALDQVLKQLHSGN